MPKIVTDQERELIKEAIYEKTKQLIKEKGIKVVTVNDIAQAVGIGKGSFYFYYPSREACLFEVLKRFEREMFSRIDRIMSSADTDKEKTIQLLKEIFMSKDSLFTAINQLDIEVLLRKLPPEYRTAEDEKSVNNFQRAMQFLNLDENRMEVVAMFTDCLGYVAGNQAYSQKGKEEFSNTLINIMADYMIEEKQHE